MIKIFNHYFHRRTVLQVMLDMGLVVGALILALYVQSNAALYGFDVVSEGLSRGILMALGMLAVNSALGLYERSRSKSTGQMRARAVLSFVLSGAIAGGVLWLLPLEPSYDIKWVVLVVLGTTGFMLTHRVMVGEMLPKALTRRRVLVYGTGPRAVTVGQSLQHASANVEMVGYFASPNETEHQVKAWATLKPGEKNGIKFETFVFDALSLMLPHCDGAVYIAMSSSELDTLQAAFRAAGGKWSTFIIWAKHTFTLGRADYQRQYEPILYGWPEGSSRHWCGDRDQGDVWSIKKPARNDLHPTMKPVELMERSIRNSSRPGDVVLDCFGGSGSTLIAAEKSGRRCFMMELDPKYCDVIVRRWQEFSGGKAISEDGQRVFDEVTIQEAPA